MESERYSFFMKIVYVQHGDSFAASKAGKIQVYTLLRDLPTFLDRIFIIYSNVAALSL